MNSITMLIALSCTFQGPVPNATAARLKGLAEATVAAPLNLPGYTVELRRASIVVDRPPTEEERRLRRRINVPEPPRRAMLPFTGLRGTAFGPGKRPAVHRIEFDVTVFGSVQDAEYASRPLLDTPGRFYRRETFLPSGLPAGRATFIAKRLEGLKGTFQHVLDGELLVEVRFTQGEVDPLARDRRLLPASPDIVETVEGVTRQILARAQAARAGLTGAQTAGPLRRAAGVAFTGFDRPANLKGGIFTFRQGARTVVAPLSAYEIRVNGRPIKLKQPVMEADGRIWIEAAALR